MKNLFSLAIVCVVMTQCGVSDPSKWTDEQINQWFEKGEFLNGWQAQADESVNHREFAIAYHRNKAVWDKAFEFLKTADLTTIPTGRVELGGKLYATVQDYVPKNRNETQFEVHIEHIDIQYVAAGKEVIEQTGIADFTVTVPYDTIKDVTRGTVTKSHAHTADSLRFFLFFPEDAHRPSLKVNEEDTVSSVRKIVVKVPVSVQ
ncbi:MAG: YhcH/YjgK/YiaL family protein [Bacteroidales bacterium]|jgi:YhcH/YjgK/YiaL family protein|nr:YhcH/YjgK/YiaL family protein [Bacteroidales bacterium]